MPFRFASSRATMARVPTGARYRSSKPAPPWARENSSRQPALERVRVSLRGHRVAHEEVARHADADDRHPDAPADLDGDDAERDRDAEPALDHGVEEGIARVVVVVPVAREAFGHEEVVDDSGERSVGTSLSDLVDAVDGTANVETGLGVCGYQQRELVEVDRWLRALHESGEASGQVHTATVATAGRASRHRVQGWMTIRRSSVISLTA